MAVKFGNLGHIKLAGEPKRRPVSVFSGRDSARANSMLVEGLKHNYTYTQIAEAIDKELNKNGLYSSPTRNSISGVVHRTDYSGLVKAHSGAKTYEVTLVPPEKAAKWKRPHAVSPVVKETAKAHLAPLADPTKGDFHIVGSHTEPDGTVVLRMKQAEKKPKVEVQHELAKPVVAVKPPIFKPKVMTAPDKHTVTFHNEGHTTIRPSTQKELIVSGPTLPDDHFDKLFDEEKTRSRKKEPLVFIPAGVMHDRDVADDALQTIMEDEGSAVGVGNGHCTLVHLKFDSCRWPVGNDIGADQLFCNKKKLPGRPYCKGHFTGVYKESDDYTPSASTKARKDMEAKIGIVKSHL